MHELWHAVLGQLSAAFSVLLAGLVAAALAWVRKRLQVSAAESAAISVELEARQAAAAGREAPGGPAKKAQAMERAAALMHPLVRPGLKALDALVEAAVPKAKASASCPPKVSP